jgi:hypothetical protein
MSRLVRGYGAFVSQGTFLLAPQTESKESGRSWA